MLQGTALCKPGQSVEVQMGALNPFQEGIAFVVVNQQCCLECRLVEPATAVWAGQAGLWCLLCLCKAVTARMAQAWASWLE